MTTTWARSTQCADHHACIEVAFTTASINNATCVEVAFATATASMSNANCVEVAFATAASCNNTSCVEVGFATAAACNNDTCVEVGFTPDHADGCTCQAVTADGKVIPGAKHGDVLVRDSKNPAGHILVFTADEWRTFIAGINAGEFPQ